MRASLRAGHNAARTAATTGADTVDTLYAEGQRRYIESFSTYARQFLEKLDKPDAERIDGIPPAISITAAKGSFGKRSLVGKTF